VLCVRVRVIVVDDSGTASASDTELNKTIDMLLKHLRT
jgi:hypothetical protein